jgi:hypothetical protein
MSPLRLFLCSVNGHICTFVLLPSRSSCTTVQYIHTVHMYSMVVHFSSSCILHARTYTCVSESTIIPAEIHLYVRLAFLLACILYIQYQYRHMSGSSSALLAPCTVQNTHTFFPALAHLVPCTVYRSYIFMYPRSFLYRVFLNIHMVLSLIL